jgi:site-specific recombinase XerD
VAEPIALALMRHFGSLKVLSRASFLELRQFLPQQKAEAVIAALSASATAETEHGLSDQLDNPESIYHACADIAHALWATAATNALDHEVDLAKVQEWFGHANISTTRIYDHRKMQPEDSPTLKVAY